MILCFTRMLFQTKEMDRYIDTANRWVYILRNGMTVPSPPEPIWTQKFPEIKWPKMKREKELTLHDWEVSNFPRRDLQEFISGQISSQAWQNHVRLGV